jgi:hypothetical protein
VLGSVKDANASSTEESKDLADDKKKRRYARVRCLLHERGGTLHLYRPSHLPGTGTLARSRM